MVVVGLVAGPVPGPATAVPAPGPGTGSGERQAATEHVVAISVDGLNPDALAELGRSGTPELHRMIDEGASTLDARTAYEITKTLPNHTGMITGRRIRGDRGHGVTVNSDPGGTVHQLAGGYRRSLFDIVHDRGGRTALYAAKTKFALFDRTWGARHGRRDKVGANDGRDKIDRYVRDRSNRLANRVVRDLETRPFAATFVHLALPDLVGHDHGWMGPEYLDAVRSVDAMVGRILAAVRGDRDLAGRVTVLLTSDHGGAGRNHEDPRGEANYTIPFLAWGAGVEAGADLYDLNPEREHPGDGRPGYRDAPPVRNTDVASLVTTLLGMPRVPGRLPGTTPLEVR